MPACKSVLFVVLLVMMGISVSPIVPTVLARDPRTSYPVLSPTASSGLGSALQWLARNQSSDGSYGEFFPPNTAAAAYALWLNDTHSARAVSAYAWLAAQLDNSSNWFWGSYGEFDIPGVSLYSIASSSNLQLVQVPSVASSFLEFQQANGGFLGFWPSGASNPVTSSVDTAEALRGLLSVRAINASSEQSAVNYLFTLQNSDGSFNLTGTMAYDPIYSQGPEPVSITTLVLLALRDASYTNTNTHVAKALSFLTTAPSKYSPMANDNNAVYSASLSALAFYAFGRTAYAYDAIAFILSHQNSDGGFRDSTRSSPGSNALDTAWASIALQQVVQGRAFSPFLPEVVIFGIIAGIVALAVIVGILVYLVRRNKTQTQVKSL